MPSNNGLVYNKMKENLPGTVFFMEKALENKNYFTLKALNTGKYLTADQYGQSQIRADRDSTGTWEHFYFHENSDGTVSIQSRANNKFFCAIFDNWDGKNPVIPRSNQIEDWEKYYINYVTDNVITIKTKSYELYVKNEETWVRAVADYIDDSTKFEITYLN